jgi:TolA-binding protein
MRTALIFAVAAALLGGTALAAPKWQKATTVQVQAVQTSKTKVQTKAKTEEPKRPVVIAEQFRTEAAAKVERLTDQAMAVMQRLIDKTPDDDPEKPDFYFRMAEHMREKKTQFSFKARELDEAIYKEPTESRKAELQRQQKGYEAAEHDWLLKAIKMYLAIATGQSYQQFKRMDECLFNVADMLYQAKREASARVFFGRLIKDYPQSKYIPDAYLSFAEFYFNDGKVEDALRLYERVAKYPNSPVYGYSIYKQGWCWLNLKRPDTALQMFVKVIKQSGAWAGAKKSKIILVKEAKKDAVRAFSHVGKPEKAWGFFQKIGGDYAGKMLEMLATLYYDQGKFVPSIETFKKLMELNPRHKETCNWQYNIMRCTLSAKDKKSQVEESKALAQVFEEAKKNSTLSKAGLTECRNNASGVLRELATTWHREAQKTQNNDTYALAQYLYKEYLDHFPQEKDAYVMTYYYAELLYKLERWPEAAEIYSKVVKMDPKGKYLKDAAYAAVISWKNALNVEDEAKETGKKEKGKGAKETVDVNKPKAIPEKEKKMIAAFDTYIRFVPDSPELVQIMYRKGRIYYNYNHYNEAVDMFSKIALKHPEHELAIYAANLMLDCLNIMKKYDDLNSWVKKFLADGRLTNKDAEFKKQLEKLEAASERKAAEELQKTGKYRDCGERYAKIANKYQDDPRWSELLYNAAMCFEAAKLIGMAISIRNTLIKVKPKDTLAQKAMYMIGGNYQALAWYSRAADYFEKFATGFPGEKEAPEALQNAIVFRLGRAEYDKAIDDAKFFEKSYGTRPKIKPKAAAVNFSLGAIYEGKHENEAIIKHYGNYLKKWGTAGGPDRQLQAHVKIGEIMWEQSCPTKQINGACIKVQRVEAKRKIAKKTGGKKKKKGPELRTQCGPETKMKVTVFKRNPAKAKAALNHFKEALNFYKKVGKGIKAENKEEQERRQTDMAYAAASAAFHQAEADFEEFLDVKFPQGLDFSDANKKKKAESEKKFKKYLDEKMKKLAATQARLEDVIKMKVAHWAIAASARIGQLYQNFADALYTAPVPKPPIPKTLTSKDAQEEFVSAFTDAYCDKLEDEAGKQENKGVQALGLCLSKSTELSWYNEWSKLCEAELNQIKPAEYPMAAEIRAEPGYVGFKPDRADLITDVK